MTRELCEEDDVSLDNRISIHHCAPLAPAAHPKENPCDSTRASRPDSPWVEDSELDAVLLLLGDAVAGLEDARGGMIPDLGVGSNCGAVFVNETFALRDYCWCEGNLHPEALDWDHEGSPWTEMPPSGGTSSGCPTNFEHFASGIRGIWYKHLGRSNEFNREPEPGEALSVLTDCLTSIDYQPTHAPTTPANLTECRS